MSQSSLKGRRRGWRRGEDERINKREFLSSSMPSPLLLLLFLLSFAKSY